ncbi:MAG: hypothetical protein VKK97_03170 [Synechococcaceae cyanobacterium]|nr:hypothetical protein [Synechococcaceae cyanobacterium]
MSSFSLARPGAAKSVLAAERMRRSPQRVCATLSWHLHKRLQERADYEGRSLSNLIAFLLEAGCPEMPD